MDTLKYSIGEVVYLKINPDPEERGLITGIVFRPNSFVYLVSFKEEERGCFEIELTSEPSFVTANAD
jgi:hypothetical protein